MTLGSHQTAVGKSQVHITPKWIIEATGPYDLDPCAADPRPWACATTNWTTHGLEREWTSSAIAPTATVCVRTRVMKSRVCVCPTCGQPCVPNELELTPTQRRILGAVQRHPGISSEELRGLVWADDPNGGPENPKTIHVHVHLLNDRLAAHGFVVRGSGSDGYRIVSHGGDTP
jgi:hypothetical protein